MKIKIIFKSKNSPEKNPIQKLNERFDQLGFRERSSTKFIFPDNTFREIKEYILDSSDIAAKIKECLLIISHIDVRAKILHAIISCEVHEFIRAGFLENHACNDRIFRYFKKHPETIPEIIELLNEADQGKLLKQLKANNLNTGSHLNKEKDLPIAEFTDIDSRKDEQLVLEVYKRFSLLSRSDKRHPLKMFDEKFSLEFLRGRIYSAGNPGKLMVACLKKINHDIGVHNLFHLLLTPPGYDNSVIKNYSEKYLDSRFLTIHKKYREQIINLLPNDPNRPFQKRAINHIESARIIYHKDTTSTVEQKDQVNLDEKNLVPSPKKEISAGETHQQSSAKRKIREYSVSREQHKPLKKLKPNRQSIEEEPVQQRINYLQKLKPSDFKNSSQSDTGSLAGFHDEFSNNPPDALTSCDERMIQDTKVNNNDQPKNNYDKNPFLMFTSVKLPSFPPASTFESNMDEEIDLRAYSMEHLLYR